MESHVLEETQQGIQTGKHFRKVWMRCFDIYPSSLSRTLFMTEPFRSKQYLNRSRINFFSTTLSRRCSLKTTSLKVEVHKFHFIVTVFLPNTQGARDCGVTYICVTSSVLPPVAAADLSFHFDSFDCDLI